MREVLRIRKPIKVLLLRFEMIIPDNIFLKFPNLQIFINGIQAYKMSHHSIPVRYGTVTLVRTGIVC
jgi:hypothetical protein